jgi:hypothetical protein
LRLDAIVDMLAVVAEVKPIECAIAHCRHKIEISAQDLY